MNYRIFCRPHRKWLTSSSSSPNMDSDFLDGPPPSIARGAMGGPEEGPEGACLVGTYACEPGNNSTHIVNPVPIVSYLLAPRLPPCGLDGNAY